MEYQVIVKDDQWSLHPNFQIVLLANLSKGIDV